jgi:hypothetical protein
MPTDHDDPQQSDVSLISAGPSFGIARRLGLAHPDTSRRLIKVGLLVVLTWVPLLILSLASGHAVAGQVKVPLLHDPVIYSRFLFVVPLLELAAVIIGPGLAVQTRQLIKSGIVSERERPAFELALGRSIRLRASVFVEGAIAVFSFAMALVARLVVFGGEDSSWERVGTVTTPAGWWYAMVGLPVLFFFLLRWLWIYLVWGHFLFRVSRLDLELVPTHPDRAGGLGFLGWGMASFGTVLMAVSAVMSGGFAYEIMHHGESLESLKYHVIVFVVAALVILHAPLLTFSGRLSRCRFAGLLEFGALAWTYDRTFDEKWIKQPGNENREGLLGSADIQALADMATAYDHVEQMRLFPFDTKAALVLLVAALIPFIPLVGTAIPLTEILMKLVKFAV